MMYPAVVCKAVPVLPDICVTLEQQQVGHGDWSTAEQPSCRRLAAPGMHMSAGQSVCLSFLCHKDFVEEMICVRSSWALLLPSSMATTLSGSCIGNNCITCDNRVVVQTASGQHGVCCPVQWPMHILTTKLCGLHAIST